MTTYDTDQKYKTDYFERFKQYLLHVQESNVMVVGGMTDPKGDRSLPPGKQADPDLFTHVVERRPDGIVIRGAKAHQTGAEITKSPMYLRQSRVRSEVPVRQKTNPSTVRQ